jgi:thiamine biosynthesis lipoprotein
VYEIRRLERTFSLHRRDSILTALNRTGFMAAPPAELLELIGESGRYGRLTRGAFDPSVQPLWALYAGHFARHGADTAAPEAGAVAAALEKVGFEAVLAERDRIAFRRRGMALTFNGIAQGYITDRVVALLRAGGIGHCLVDMGESRSLGMHPDGRPWQVGIADPLRPEQTLESVPLLDRAIATSGAYGFRFDTLGRFHHLFDPKSGRSPDRYRSVTVIMPTATAADAFSTAFSVMAPADIRSTLLALGHGQARLIMADGRRLVLDG